LTGAWAGIMAQAVAARNAGNGLLVSLFPATG